MDIRTNTAIAACGLAASLGVGAFALTAVGSSSAEPAGSTPALVTEAPQPDVVVVDAPVTTTAGADPGAMVAAAEPSGAGYVIEYVDVAVPAPAAPAEHEYEEEEYEDEEHEEEEYEDEEHEEAEHEEYPHDEAEHEEEEYEEHG